MKIQLQRQGCLISCKHCLVGFTGHAICSDCAKGYFLKDIEGDGETRLARLVHVFTLVETRTELNKIRVKVYNPSTETDIVVRYSEVMFHGHSTVLHTHYEYWIEPTKCPECKQGSLRFGDNACSECPNCGSSHFHQNACGEVQPWGFGPPLSCSLEVMRTRLQLVMSLGSEKTYRYLRETLPEASHQKIYELMTKGLDITPEEFSQLTTRVDAEDPS